MVTFLEPEEIKSEDEEETTYQPPPEIIVEKPRRHKLQSIRQLHEESEAPPVVVKKDKRYEPRERFNPLYGLLIMISATLVAIFTMAVLLEMKKKGAAPKAESMNPYMEKSGNSSGVLEATTMAEEKKRRICDSPECITLSYQLLNWRDTSIDPCDDFYQATWGKCIEQSGYRGFMGKNSMEFLTEYFHKNQSSDSKSENTLKMYFRECEELKTQENFMNDQHQGYRDLFKDVQYIGPWPLASLNLDEFSFDLNEMLLKMAQQQTLDFGIFQFTTNEKVLKLSASSEVNWLDKKFVKIIQKILQVNNIDVPNSELQRDIKNVQNFIKTLSETLEESENQINLTTLKTNVPGVNIERIIKSLVPSDDQERVMERIEVDEKLSGNSTSVKLFPGVATRILSKNISVKENLKYVDEMVEDNRKSYLKSINESTWLHQETKENMISKLRNMKKTVGYPMDFEEEGAMEKTFEMLTTSPTDSWYTFIKKALRFQNQQNIEYTLNDELLNPTNPPKNVMALYKKHENSLIVIVPISDDHLFNSKFPKLAKMVPVGRSIAKEMGRSLEGTSGWTSEDQDEQRKREECLEKKLREEDGIDSEKKVSNALKSIKTDQVAIESLWITYKDMDWSEEPIIPGFHDSDSDKLFFKLYALNSCSQSSSESQLSHHYRVNGVLSNLKSFSETFNCPTETSMNPKTKCELL
ncbi:hypothetical protein CAEBREN_32290 [Caenorhabditis brenneri]|uniref:Peptidase M13 N-terminal domain-containing protein n=1 Tax=Caenorhabditis brenneri TaxID=135651 RepID=G0NQI4_CAEBE|nr:hypothetical protein CAEBREN_32290 [Caenorhabditis brenneri]